MTKVRTNKVYLVVYDVWPIFHNFVEVEGISEKKNQNEKMILEAIRC